MSPELIQILKNNEIDNEKINIDKSNIFSIGIIILRMIFLLEELNIKGFN